MSKGKPVVFLDRDGVLTREKGYVTSIEDLEIFSYSNIAINLIHQAGYMVVVITNQSAVARDLLDEEELVKIHEYLKKETKVDAVYYCPHLPPESGQEEHMPYRINCKCRKPKDGLMLMASDELNLDLTNAYFVGDRASDIIAGESIGAITVLLESGYGSDGLEDDVKPNMCFNDLLEFAIYINGEKQNAF